MSNNLNLAQMVENQDAPEVTHNDAMAQLDAAFTETFEADVSGGNVTLSNDEMRDMFRTYVTGGAAARDVTFPAIKRFFMIHIDSGNTNDITLKVGSTSVALSPGSKGLVYTDGTANGLAVFNVTVADGPPPFDMYFFQAGKPDDGATVIKLICIRPFRLPANLAGSVITSIVAADATADFDILKNGSSFGTISFAAAATTATKSTTATSFAVNDVLTIVNPSPQDADLSGVAFSLYGQRTG